MITKAFIAQSTDLLHCFCERSLLRRFLTGNRIISFTLFSCSFMTRCYYLLGTIALGCACSTCTGKYTKCVKVPVSPDRFLNMVVPRGLRDLETNGNQNNHLCVKDKGVYRFPRGSKSRGPQWFLRFVHSIAVASNHKIIPTVRNTCNYEQERLS